MGKINDDDNEAFDSLFNNEDNEENEERTKPPKGLADFMRNLINSMTGDEIDFEDNYGTPTSIEYFEENGYYVERKVWSVDGGDVVEVTRSNEPFENGPKLTLEEQLAKAIEVEDYEEAVRVRDLMKTQEDGI